MENDQLKPWRELPARALPLLLQHWYKNCLLSTQAAIRELAATWPIEAQKWYADDRFLSLPIKHYLSAIERIHEADPPLYESLRFFVFGSKSQTPAIAIVPNWRELPIEEIPERIRMWFYGQNPSNRTTLNQIARKTNIRWPSATEPLQGGQECLAFIAVLKEHDQTLYDSVVQYIQQAPPSEKQETPVCYADMLPSGWRLLSDDQLSQTVSNWYWQCAPGRQRQIQEQMRFLDQPLDFGAVRNAVATLPREQIGKFVCTSRKNNTGLCADLTEFVNKATQANLLPAVEQKKPDVNDRLLAPAEPPATVTDDLPASWKAVAAERLAGWLTAWYWTQLQAAREQLTAIATECGLPYITDTDYYETSHMNISRIVAAIKQKNTELYARLLGFVQQHINESSEPITAGPAPEQAKAATPEPPRPPKPTLPRPLILDEAWALLLRGWYRACNDQERQQMADMQHLLPAVDNIGYYRQHPAQRKRYIEQIQQLAPALYAKFMEYVKRTEDTRANLGQVTASDVFNEQDDLPEAWRDLDITVLATGLNHWYYSSSPDIQQRVQDALQSIPALQGLGESGRPDTTLTRKQLAAYIDRLQCADMQLYELLYTFIADSQVKKAEPPATVTDDLPPSYAEVYAAYEKAYPSLRPAATAESAPVTPAAAAPTYAEQYVAEVDKQETADLAPGPNVCNADDGGLPLDWAHIWTSTLAIQVRDWYLQGDDNWKDSIRKVIGAPLVRAMTDPLPMRRSECRDVVGMLRARARPLYENLWQYVAARARQERAITGKLPTNETKTAVVLPQELQKLPPTRLSAGVSRWYLEQPASTRMRIREILRARNTNISPGTKTWPNRHMPVSQLVDIATALQTVDTDLYASLLAHVANKHASDKIPPTATPDGPLPLWWETLPQTIQETAMMQAGIVPSEVVSLTEQFRELRKRDNLPAEMDLLELICTTLYTMHNQKLIDWTSQVKPPVPVVRPKKKPSRFGNQRPSWLSNTGIPATLDIDTVVVVLQAWINKHCCGVIKKFNEVGHDTPFTLEDLRWRSGHSAETAYKLVKNMISPEPAAVATAKRLLTELEKWKLPTTLPEPLPPHLTICAQLQQQLKKIELLEAAAAAEGDAEAVVTDYEG